MCQQEFLRPGCRFKQHRGSALRTGAVGGDDLTQAVVGMLDGHAGDKLIGGRPRGGGEGGGGAAGEGGGGGEGGMKDEG